MWKWIVVDVYHVIYCIVVRVWSSSLSTENENGKERNLGRGSDCYLNFTVLVRSRLAVQ